MATATPTFTNTALGYQATPNANATPAQIASGENSLSKQGFMPTQTGQPAVASPTYTPSTSGSSAPTNNYSVVTSQPAQNNLSNIKSTYNNTITPNIAAATANTAATTAATNASNSLPVIAGYNVSATKTGAQGETTMTNPLTGQTAYVSPQEKLATASDVQNILSGTDTTGSNPAPSAPATPAQTATAQTGIDPNAETANYQNQITTQQSTLDSAYSTFQSMVQTIQSGSFPLSGAQQALVDATNQAFQQMTTESNLKAAALSSETGGVSNMVNATQGELLNITSDQAAAVAKLELGFQNQDYTEITDSYKAFTDAETQKMDSIQKLHDSVMATYNTALDAAQKQQTEQQQQQQDEITNQQKQEQIDETIQQNATSDYINSQGTWSIHDNTDGTESLVNDKTGATQAMAPNNIITGGGTAGSTGIPILDDNTKTTSSGIPYIDGSSLTGKTATTAQNEAAQMGIPYIDKTNATLLNNIETSRTNLTNIGNDLQGLSPSSGITRPFDAVGHYIEGATQIGPGATQIQAYKDDVSSMVQTVKSMLGQNNVPRALIQPILDNIPTVNDTSAVVTAKIAKLNNALNAVEKGIVGGTLYDQYNPDSAITDLQTYSSASPEHAQQIASIRAAQPNLTPDQVLQLVQP
jgi:hypothetical protein